MPRKGPAPRRDLMPDPIYRSVLVTQLVNKVLSRGKRSLAERVVYAALDDIKDKTGTEPIATLKRAIENTKPQLEVKSRRVGEPPTRCRSRCVPAGPPPWRSAGLSATAASAGRRRWPKRLANELLDASNGVGAERGEDCTRWPSEQSIRPDYRW